MLIYTDWQIMFDYLQRVHDGSWKPKLWAVDSIMCFSGYILHDYYLFWKVHYLYYQDNRPKTFIATTAERICDVHNA